MVILAILHELAEQNGKFHIFLFIIKSVKMVQLYVLFTVFTWILSIFLQCFSTIIFSLCVTMHVMRMNEVHYIQSTEKTNFGYSTHSIINYLFFFYLFVLPLFSISVFLSAYSLSCPFLPLLVKINILQYFI